MMVKEPTSLSCRCHTLASPCEAGLFGAMGDQGTPPSPNPWTHGTGEVLKAQFGSHAVCAMAENLHWSSVVVITPISYPTLDTLSHRLFHYKKVKGWTHSFKKMYSFLNVHVTVLRFIHVFSFDLSSDFGCYVGSFRDLKGLCIGLVGLLDSRQDMQR